MYICLCKAVTDKQIQQAVGEGAETMRDLRERFDIATGCGKCGRDARRVLREAVITRQDQAAVSLLAAEQVILPTPALLSATA